LPFLKISGTFALMRIGIRNKLGLALSILLGGLVLGLLCGMELAAVFKVGALAVTEEQFLFPAALVGLILILSSGHVWPRLVLFPAAGGAGCRPVRISQPRIASAMANGAAEGPGADCSLPVCFSP
jgi:hypothetical protein